MRKISILIALLALIAGLAYYFTTMSTVSSVDAYNLVPADAALVTEIEKPVRSYRQLNNSDVWTFLRRHPKLGSVDSAMQKLTENIGGKERALSYLLKGKMLLSTHLLPNNEGVDYLFIIDLQHAGMLTNKTGSLSKVLQKSGYQINTMQYAANKIYELHNADAPTTEALYLSQYQNLVIASYKKILVEKALAASNQAYWLQQQDFQLLQTEVGNGGLAKTYINYNNLPQLVAHYTGSAPAPVQAIAKMLTYSGLQFNLSNTAIDLNGKSILQSQTPTYLRKMVELGTKPIKAQNVLPSNTAMFLSISFNDVQEFKNVIQQISGSTSTTKTDPISNMIESELKNWMEHEIAYAQIPIAANSPAMANIAIIPTGSKQAKVRQKLTNIISTLDQLNPLSIFKKQKKQIYNGHRIIKIPVKGALKKVGGNIFSQVDQPSLVMLNEYLVFCDNENILKRIIDHYTEGTTLSNTRSYNQFFKKFNKKSNVFLYGQTAQLYPFILSNTNSKGRITLQENEAYIKAFPQIGLQLLPENASYKTHLQVEFVQP